MIDFTDKDIDMLYQSGKTMAEYFSDRYKLDNPSVTSNYTMDTFITNLVNIKKNMMVILKYFNNPSNMKQYYDYDITNIKAVEKRVKIDKKILKVLEIIREQHKLINQSYIELEKIKPIDDIRKNRPRLITERNSIKDYIKNCNIVSSKIDTHLRHTENEEIKNLRSIGIIAKFKEYLIIYNTYINNFLKISK